MQQLLSSLRVVELGHFIAAPFATRTLADLGADVIKVEPPGRGDPVRGWGRQIDGRSLWWSMHGRNKRCVTANLKSAEGRDLVLKLIANADVVIENFRPGQLEGLGLGPDVMAAAKPDLILVRISGYGQTGPDAHRAGFGVIGEAKGGIRHLCNHLAADSALPPVRVGVSIGDNLAGLYAAIGALSAVLDQRSRDVQEMRIIDVALTESVVAQLEGIIPEHGYDGLVRQPQGSRLPTAAPSNAYPTSDGDWVLIAANSDKLFAALARIMGQPDLATRPEFADDPARLRNVVALDEMIAGWSRGLTAEAVVAACDDADIPVTKIYTVADIAADAQYRARGMLQSVPDDHFGHVVQPAVVPHVEGIDRHAQVRWAGPDVGAHNADVYAEFAGCSDADIAELKDRGAI
ncbi:MAG: CoA transferase [Pseudomonadota bacterium]